MAESSAEYGEDYEEEEEEEEEGDGGRGEEEETYHNYDQRGSAIPYMDPAFAGTYLNPRDEYTPVGNNTLRSGKRSYTPCVLDRTGWENFYLSLPMDYDIRNDPTFSCLRSTYKRLGDLGFKWPEPTTSEALRTGHCGPDKDSLTRPSFLHGRLIDKRPEIAYRLHLADRTALHYMRADPLEGVLPFGRKGDMLKSKSVSHRDFKWRSRCCAKMPTHPTMERMANRYPKTDLHDTELIPGVVTFSTDNAEKIAQSNLMKLRRAYLWPINTITGEPLGGHLMYHQDDPCNKNREEIWPCGEKSQININPIWIPEERCSVMANRLRTIPRTRERHFHNKSYLDMRYPMRNYECWEEVPGCCGKPENVPAECCFLEAETKLPDSKKKADCPPRGPCPNLSPPTY